jgi:hypothetical protein
MKTIFSSKIQAVLFFLIAVPRLAFGLGSLSLDYSGSSTSKSYGISGSIDFFSDEDGFASFDLGYTKTPSTSTTPNAAEDLSVGLLYSRNGQWSLGVSGNSASASADQVKNLGSEVFFSYRYKFTEGEDFNPSLRLRVSTFAGNYLQNNLDLTQQSGVGLALRLKPLEWLSLKASTKSYSYTIKPPSFISRVSYTTLTARQVGFGVGFSFTDNIELSLSRSNSTSALDSTNSISTTALLSISFLEKFSVDLGVLKSDSPATSTSAASSSTTTLATFNFDF